MGIVPGYFMLEYGDVLWEEPCLTNFSYSALFSFLLVSSPSSASRSELAITMMMCAE